MIIVAKTTFLHGRQRFDAGARYDVPDGPGYYFCANGWAEDVSGVAPTGAPGSEPVTLKIDNSVLGIHAGNVGE